MCGPSSILFTEKLAPRHGSSASCAQSLSSADSASFLRYSTSINVAGPCSWSLHITASLSIANSNLASVYYTCSLEDPSDSESWRMAVSISLIQPSCLSGTRADADPRSVYGCDRCIGLFPHPDSSDVALHSEKKTSSFQGSLALLCVCTPRICR